MAASDPHWWARYPGRWTQPDPIPQPLAGDSPRTSHGGSIQKHNVVVVEQRDGGDAVQYEPVCDEF